MTAQRRLAFLKLAHALASYAAGVAYFTQIMLAVALRDNRVAVDSAEFWADPSPWGPS